MSPLMRSVEKEGILALQGKKGPHRIIPKDFFEPVESLRIAFAELIACDRPEQIALIPSVSYGIASVIKNLEIRKGQDIVIVGEQFPSNAYPWFRVAKETDAKVNIVAPPEALEERGKRWNERVLEAIDNKTTVVALPHCHWADGTKFDLKEIRRRTHEVGAAMIIDGTQSVGALPFDIQEMDPDALICAGYKWLLGPYSLGLAYYHPRFNEGVPVEENWINRIGSEDFAGLADYEERYQPGALRFGMGEQSNFVLVPMLRESIRQILQWGVENIQEYCRSISRNMMTDAEKGNFWVEDDEYLGHHLFGIKMPGEMDMEEVKQQLELNKIFVSIRGNSVRVSPHVYNTREDLEKLDQILRESIKSELSL